MATEAVNARESAQNTLQSTISEWRKTAFSYPPESFEAAISEFLDYQEARGASKHTIQNYSRTLRAWSTWVREKRYKARLDQYTLGDHAAWLMSMQDSHKGTTVDSYHAIVSSCMVWSFKEGRLPKNPLGNFKKRLAEPPLPKALPWEMVEVHIAQVKSRYAIVQLRDRMVIRLMARTGLRPGEVVMLQRSSVDVEEKRLIVVNTKGRLPRSVYYPDAIHPYMLEWLEASYRQWPNSPWLFPSRAGKQYYVRDLQKAFRDYGVATPHSYRHTWATKAMEEGASLRDIQDVLGHKNIQTTTIYTRIVDARKKAIANLIK